MGEYTDSGRDMIRTQALDCPVGGAAAACPGSGGAGAAATLRRLRQGRRGARGHADGEIWAETLWDLRAARRLGARAAGIVTDGMRLSPPEPSFLDVRDAILLADRQLFPQGDHSEAIWAVFGTRGMGADASSPTATTALEGFQAPRRRRRWRSPPSRAVRRARR